MWGLRSLGDGGVRCVYCDLFLEEKTMDHVPPKSFFPKGTCGLITVPSCCKCNNGATKDDEYFRAIVAFARESSSHPGAAPAIEKATRSMFRQEAQGLAKSILETTEECILEETDGTSVPSATYRIDPVRVGNVVSRIAVGLLWHETQLHLPEDYVVVTCPSYNLQHIELFDDFAIMKLLSNDPKSIGKGIFQYWWNQDASREKCDSVWFLRFYQGISYICLIGPKGIMANGLSGHLHREGWISVNDKGSFNSICSIDMD